MKKNQAREHIDSHLSPEEKLIGFFFAQRPMKLWYFIVLGPLAILTMRMYYIAVTDKGVHFHKLNLLGKFLPDDFFSYDEICSMKVRKGLLQTPIKYHFQNGRKLNIKGARGKGKHAAGLDDMTLAYMKQHIEQK